MSTSVAKSAAGQKPATKQPSARVVQPARSAGIAAIFGNDVWGALLAKQAANQSNKTERKPVEAPASEAASADAHITKITFDKTSLQATYYLKDAFGLRTITRQVLDHSDPAPGSYVAEVFRDSDGQLKWKLPRGSSAQPGKGFIFVTKERVPGTLKGVSQIDVDIIGGAAGEFLATGASSRSASLDAETRARIGEKLLQAGVTAEDLELFHAGASEPALNEGDFERAVDAFLAKRQAQRAARDTAMSNLAHAMDFVSGPGAEVVGGSGVDVTMVDIYKEYQVYLRSLSGSTKEFSRDEALKLPRQLALDSKLQERYGIGLEEFEKRIGVFEQAFRAATVNLAFSLLDRAEGICNRYLRELPEAGTLGVHEKPAQMVRTLDPVRPSIAAELEAAEQKTSQERLELAQARMDAMNGIPSNYKAIQARIAAAEKAEKAALDRVLATLSAFPVAQLPGFPSRKLLQAMSAADAAYVINWYLLEQVAGIKAVREQLAKDSKRIYQLDSLLELARKQFGLNADSGPERSIFKLIIDDEVRRASELTGWQQLELTIQFALMLTSMAFPGAVVVTAPLLAATSAHEAWVGITDYREDHAASQVGFRAEDPSTLWLMLSVIGMGFDVGDVFQALHRLPALRTAIDEFSRTLNPKQLADALDKVPELDPKVAAAIVKAAQTRPPEVKVTPPSYGNLPPSTPPIERIDSPNPYPWVDSDYQPGVARISDGSGGPKGGDGPVPPKNTSPVEAETPNSQKPQSTPDVEDVDPSTLGAEPTLDPKVSPATPSAPAPQRVTDTPADEPIPQQPRRRKRKTTVPGSARGRRAHEEREAIRKERKEELDKRGQPGEIKAKRGIRNPPHSYKKPVIVDDTLSSQTYSRGDFADVDTPSNFDDLSGDILLPDALPKPRLKAKKLTPDESTDYDRWRVVDVGNGTEVLSKDAMVSTPPQQSPNAPPGGSSVPPAPDLRDRAGEINAPDTIKEPPPVTSDPPEPVQPVLNAKKLTGFELLEYDRWKAANVGRDTEVLTKNALAPPPARQAPDVPSGGSPVPSAPVPLQPYPRRLLGPGKPDPDILDPADSRLGEPEWWERELIDIGVASRAPVKEGDIPLVHRVMIEMQLAKLNSVADKIHFKWRRRRNYPAVLRGDKINLNGPVDLPPRTPFMRPASETAGGVKADPPAKLPSFEWDGSRDPELGDWPKDVFDPRDDMTNWRNSMTNAGPSKADVQNLGLGDIDIRVSPISDVDGVLSGYATKHGSELHIADVELYAPGPKELHGVALQLLKYAESWRAETIRLTGTIEFTGKARQDALAAKYGPEFDITVPATKEGLTQVTKLLKKKLEESDN